MTVLNMYGPPVDLSFKNINCLAGNTLSYLLGSPYGMVSPYFMSCIITIDCVVFLTSYDLLSTCGHPILGYIATVNCT